MLQMEHKPNVELTTVTPEMAKIMLEEFGNNFRKPDRNRVLQYAKDMSAGTFALTGDTIKLSETDLLDGRHRLLACIVSGQPFDTFIARGLPDGVAMHIDRGRPRTISQWLSHEGVKNSNAAAAVARMSFLHDKGMWKYKSVSIKHFTDAELIQYALTFNEPIQESIRMTANQRLATRSILSTVLFIGSGKRDVSGNSTCKWFNDSLKAGSDLPSTEPVLHLRNRLADTKTKQSAAITPFVERMLISKAWNMTVNGESCETHNALRIRLSGPAPSKPIDKILVATE